MPRDYGVYLEDILAAIAKIEHYLEGVGFEEFAEDSIRADAVLYNLMIISEAVRAIPDSVKDERPSVEWRKIAGLRNLIAHEYFGVDLEIIWDVIQNKLADLRRSISIMLDELE